MGIFQKVTNLFKTREKIDKEIDNIQKSCKHSKKSLKSIRERVDSHTTVIRWVCDDCSQTIGIPDQKELEKYING